jgi:hypothetical protein
MTYDKKKSTDEVEKTKRKQRIPKTLDRRIRSKTKQRDAEESFLIVFLQQTVFYFW